MADRIDTYEEITARILQALEQGVPPWRRPWTTSAAVNVRTERPYRGINTLLLALENRADPRWGTFRGILPPNLNVRLSAHMIGGTVPTFRGLPVTVSTVTAEGEPPAGARRCPAPLQGNACGSCRACWDPAIPIVDYHLH